MYSLLNMQQQKTPPAKNKTKSQIILTWLGFLLILAGVSILIVIYLPVVYQEIQYLLRPPESKQVTPVLPDAPESQDTDAIIPVSTDFGIVIPKIGANVSVVENVDPYNEEEYQVALTQGVAHALGTSFPDKTGNTFLFAHSATDRFNANRYNAVFYLLTKLEEGDPIYVFYNNSRYTYRTVSKEIVAPEAVNVLDTNPVLESDRSDKSLTLMTCWPAGTTINRLIVVAEPL